MHVVFGGIFNGKKAYVERVYKPTRFVHSQLERLDCVDEVIAIEQFEALIEPYIHLDEIAASTCIFEQVLRLSEHNTVVCICHDISRGVVPLDATLRKQRDILGRLYQQLFMRAKTVTRIFYGLPEQIKEED